MGDTLNASVGRLTLVATVGLPTAAVIMILSGVPSGSIGYLELTADFAAVLSLLLAWRYRRRRLFLAAGTVALAAHLARSPAFLPGYDGTLSPGTALPLLLALDLALIAVVPEGPVFRWSTAVLAAVIAVQPLLVARLPALAEYIRLPEAMMHLAATPQLIELAFVIATAFLLVALTLRRGAFEVGLFGVLAAVAMALVWRPGVRAEAPLFAAAQLVLLLGVIEDAYRLAFVDALTGLPGRRALDEALRGLRGEFTVAMVDVDHFKRFNDRHGHEAGDQALRMLARCLRSTGGKARAFRYGGEEFAVVFPSMGLAEARPHLEDLRRMIAQRRFTLRSPDRPKKRPDRPKKPAGEPKTVRLTVSIGAAASKSGRSGGSEALLAADRALYRAKRAGRNRLSTG